MKVALTTLVFFLTLNVLSQIGVEPLSDQPSSLMVEDLSIGDFVVISENDLGYWYQYGSWPLGMYSSFFFGAEAHNTGQQTQENVVLTVSIDGAVVGESAPQPIYANSFDTLYVSSDQVPDQVGGYIISYDLTSESPDVAGNNSTLRQFNLTENIIARGFDIITGEFPPAGSEGDMEAGAFYNVPFNGGECVGIRIALTAGIEGSEFTANIYHGNEPTPLASTVATVDADSLNVGDEENDAIKWHTVFFNTPVELSAGVSYSIGLACDGETEIKVATTTLLDPYGNRAYANWDGNGYNTLYYHYYLPVVHMIYDMPILGCTNDWACNYDPEAEGNDGSCIYAEEYYDCEGNCLNDIDEDGICDEIEGYGCTDPLACNYDQEVGIDDGSCTYGDGVLDCEGNCNNDVDEDGVCDEWEIFGCTDPGALNYNLSATEEDGSCFYEYVYGCTSSYFVEYDPEANTDDGSCIIHLVHGTFVLERGIEPDSIGFTVTNTLDDGVVQCCYPGWDVAYRYNWTADTCYQVTMWTDGTTGWADSQLKVYAAGELIHETTLEDGSVGEFFINPDGFCIEPYEYDGPMYELTDAETVEYGMIIAPNPGFDFAQIRSSEWIDEELVKFEVYDLNGRLVMSQSLVSSNGAIQEQIDFTRLHAGYYLITLQQEERIERMPWLKK